LSRQRTSARSPTAVSKQHEIDQGRKEPEDGRLLGVGVVEEEYTLDHALKQRVPRTPAAPPLALDMAKAVFVMGASSCIESYVMSRMLSEGPKVINE
jgi:hypothetical protein